MIWIHASSVGEVQAAGILIEKLKGDASEAFRFVVTSMTDQGHRVAENQLSQDVICLLAPLDVPFLVRRALKKIDPAAYICLETELWPAMLTEARKHCIRMLLLNGRMSEQSCRRYSMLKNFIGGILSGFTAIGAVSIVDKERFVSLGYDESLVRVTGNIKYDRQPADQEATETRYHDFLDLQNRRVFLCGSTRDGEEKMLANVYRRLREYWKQPLLWLVAPRHLERVPAIRSLFAEEGLQFDLFSEIKKQGRRHDVVLIDCMGELAGLYSIGDFIFCGGSLVNKGGHNVMEVVRWGKPVYYGPSMHDFRDAAELLEPAGAGFKVSGPDALADLIISHMQDEKKYREACRAAARIAALHHGTAGEQADMVFRLFAT